MKRHSQNFGSVMFSQKNFGGAAMEYIIVSTFAALISITAIGFVGKIFKDKMRQLGKKMHVETEVNDELFDLDL